MAGTQDVKQKLIFAVQDGNLEEVKFLTNGLDDGFLSSWSPGFQLLCQALKNRHIEIAKVLVGHGCLLKIGSQETTALHIAVLHGDVEVIEMIRDRKQKVRRYISRVCSTRDLDEKGMAALHIFAQRRPVDEECSQVLDHLLLSLSKIDIKHAESGFTPMHFAADCGNVEMIPLLLKKNAPVNVKAKQDRTPLHLAVANGHSETVRELLKNQVDPNARQICPGASRGQKESAGYTSLHIAAEKEHVEILNILLEYGAKPNAVDEFGRTPLHIGIRNGSLPIVTALMNSNCELSSFFTLEQPNGFSPFHVAVEIGNKELVKLFLDIGIPVDSTTQEGYTSLHLAARKGDTSTIEVLLECNANPSAKGPTVIETALFFAAKSGCLEAVKILYEAIRREDVEGLEGYASLFVAAYHGHEVIVRMILDNGIDLNVNFGKYLTPLQAAAQKGHENIVNLLLEHGEEVNPKVDDHETNKKFFTPLIAACLSGHRKIVKILLDRGADMNVKITSNPVEINSDAECLLTYGYYSYSEFLSKECKLGYMPIHFAAASGEKEVVEILLERGANVNAKDDDGGTPLCVAVKHQQEEVVVCLLENGATSDAEESGQSVLLKAVSTNNFNIVQMLLYSNAPINITSAFKGEKGYTPLHLAVMESTPSIIELLLKRDSVVDVGTEKDIPLHCAIERNEECIIRKLIEYGACVNSQCSNGLTPLFHALKKSNIEVIKFLLKKGASLHMKTDKDESLLEFAVVHKVKQDVIKLLVEFGTFLDASEFSLLSIYDSWVLKRENPGGDCNYAELLKFFVKWHLDVNSKVDSSGSTILHHACHAGRADIVELLLEHDADINILDKEGHTPFWYAVEAATDAWDKFHKKCYSSPSYKDECLIRQNFEDDIGSRCRVPNNCERKTAREIMRNSDEYVKIARLMAHEVAKLEAAGEYLHLENISLLRSDFITDHYDLCQKEIVQLKEKKIAGLVSYFDILIASEIKLVYYARNSKIKKSLRYTSCTFPLYEKMLKARFERGEEREFLIGMTTSFFKRVLQLQMPSMVTDQIFDYLWLTDLKNFCRACKPSIFVSHGFK